MMKIQVKDARRHLYGIFNEETGAEVMEFIYVNGHPKNYRADCSNGKINFEGNPVGKTFSFQPISWRFFNDVLFDDKKKNTRKDWVELFFVDNNKCLSCISFHGYSVQNLTEEMTKLVYQGKFLDECEVKVSFKEKRSKENDSLFYIAEFEIIPTERSQEIQDALTVLPQQVPLYRISTIQETGVMLIHHNYPENMLLLAPVEADTIDVSEEKLVA